MNFTHSTFKCAKNRMRLCGIGLWLWSFHFPWLGSPRLPSSSRHFFLHPFHWSKRHVPIPCMLFAGHEEREYSLRLIYLASILLKSVLPHSINGGCSSEPKAQILRQAFSLPQAMPGKIYHHFQCSWLPSAFPKFLPHQIHSKLDPWEGQMLTWDLPSHPLSPLLGNGVFLSHDDMLSSFLNSIFTWIHFWHYCLRNFWKTKEGKRCPYWMSFY